jgi:hypothetical protein
MRTSEPVRIGMPISSPNSVSLRPSSVLILTPMMEKIVHTAKQTVKAMVDIESARVAAAVPEGSFILSRSMDGGRRSVAENKKSRRPGFASARRDRDKT